MTKPQAISIYQWMVSEPLVRGFLFDKDVPTEISRHDDLAREQLPKAAAFLRTVADALGEKSK